MKIIVWNCNMAFRKKVQYISVLKPDIMIIPECECPEKMVFENEESKPFQALWHGTNNNKGIGIFSFNNFEMKELDCHNKEFKMIIPIHVKKGDFQFNLFAIWANNVLDKKNQYVGQIWKALHHYNDLFKEKASILAGDFNSNTIWDQPRRVGNHTHVVNLLSDYDIHSCYHKHYNYGQGKERHSTLYMYRHKNKGYHIDYCFASKGFLNNLDSVEVGKYKVWSKYSDHVPLIINFK
jgi:exonuclease III